MKQKMFGELGNALKIDVGSGGKSNENGEHKEKVLLSVQNTLAVRPPKKRIRFLEFMLRQIPFMGRKFWTAQGAAAFAMSGILYLSAAGELERLSVRHIPPLMGILAVMLVMSSIPFILMPYRYQMYEIEMVSRISLSRLLMAKMTLLAAEYVIVFVCSAGALTGTVNLSMARLAFYFGLPLLAACTGCVQIIRHTDKWKEASQRAGVCEGYCVCLGAVLIILYDRKPALYESMETWSILSFLLFLVLILSVRLWMKESARIGGRAGVIDHI